MSPPLRLPPRALTFLSLSSCSSSCLCILAIFSGQNLCTGLCWFVGLFFFAFASAGLEASNIGCRIRRRALINLGGKSKIFEKLQESLFVACHLSTIYHWATNRSVVTALKFRFATVSGWHQRNSGFNFQSTKLSFNMQHCFSGVTLTSYWLGVRWGWFVQKFVFSHLQLGMGAAITWRVWKVIDWRKQLRWSQINSK